MRRCLKITLMTLLIGFFVACDQKSSQKTLYELIDQYENYERSDRSAYPLGDYREETIAAYAHFCETLKEQLTQLNPDTLNEDDRISYELLTFILTHKVLAYEFKTHWNPILSDAGFHNNLTYNVRPITSKKGALNYLNKLKAVPQYIEQQMNLIRKGLDAGMGQPLVIFKGYESTYEMHITKTAEENFYYSPFLELPNPITEQEKDSLQKAAAEIITSKIIPTFKQIKTFFETEYYPKTRTAIGVSTTPKGKEYYQNRIDYYTTLSLTAEEIHKTGLEEVNRIRNQMEKIIADLEYDGDFNAFLNFLRTDPQFYAKTPEELLMHARNIAKKLDEQLPRYFITLPRKPYGVAPVPDAIAPKYTGGRYVGTDPDSSDPGYYWVNTYNLPSRPLYVLPSLTAHEAVPGHHLQGALNAELAEEIPQFRKDLYLSAYGEGWGLYTEYLAEEMGIYTTPYEHFGKLTYEMWRACRLVVDTGIHAFGWSREQAVAFMAENTALSLHEVNTEIDRYISWPGQALAYKIGELKIKALRKKVEEQLGTAFDIRAFHELILEKGTVTLPLLEERIQQSLAPKPLDKKK